VLQDQDIVCISSIDWDFIWQGHQQIMSMLAEGGNRVLFVENTGVRRPRLDDLGRLRHRFHRWRTSTRGFRQEAPNVHVLSPLVLPWPYSRVARRINRALLLGAIRRWMRGMKFKEPIVWIFLPTPLAREVLRALSPRLSIYYCVDDLASSSPQARPIRQTEDKLFSEVDLVFVTSERLATLARRCSDRVHVFPFAVDYPPFAAARAGGVPPPPDLAALPGPVVGYLGGIHRWIDQTLLAETARRLPNVTFALVGPLQTEVGSLARCPNVRFLGSCPHAEVPRYLRAFDVALIPYQLTEYTASVYPTKLNEYLAMGLPVVATALPEIARFNAEHGDVVAVGRTTDDFVASVRAALEPSHPVEIARRIAVAQSNGWEARVAAMSGLIEARLAQRHPQHLSR
jgi:glycosyltransferase involved in cell wall biosynthesis